ncbi:hypothetical protein [Thiobaca trueperi]|uniref:Uncharacterized protein n=1 Tax=Thiobaca trueperi TaxID=127458 RepID=A0A4R3MWB6_9GAMM|nr:hypothetical protein [Thiobaca trueperi]TCT20870.1 hypothetical protein EDC35_105314 [Thiobaca trueperi]
MTKTKKPKDRPVMAGTLHRQGDWLWIPLRDEWRDVANKAGANPNITPGNCWGS